MLPEDPVKAFFEDDASRKNDRSLVFAVLSHWRGVLREITAERVSEPLPRVAEGKGSKLSTIIRKRVLEPGSCSLWGGVLDAIQKQSPSVTQRNDASCMFRLLVFESGEPDPHANPTVDQAKVSNDHIGTRDEVFLLYRTFRGLDEDDSGRVDITELRSYAERHLADSFEQMDDDALRLLNSIAPGVMTMSMWIEATAAERTHLMTRLCEKISRLLLGKKSSFALEDAMKLIWPNALRSELNEMQQWCKEFAEDSMRRELPPTVLDAVEFEGLCSVFRHYDQEKAGALSFGKLVSTGLIRLDEVDAFRQDWDKDGNGLLDMSEFCDMMCPVGYRACERSKIGSKADGTRLIFDPKFAGWRVLRKGI
jgi:Ca2+-binding EF-hand superfamily protein